MMTHRTAFFSPLRSPPVLVPLCARPPPLIPPLQARHSTSTSRSSRTRCRR
jgi:hypothetical protein